MNNDFAYIVVVLDRSGSMESMREAAISGFNEFIVQLQAEAGEVTLKLVQFDDQYETVFEKPLAEVPRLTSQTFVPRGSTALLDAQGRTIVELGQELAKLPEAARPGKVIVMTLTDGMENASKEYTLEHVSAMIRHQREIYNWEFLYLGANQDAIGVAADMGIPLRSAMSYASNPAALSHSLMASARLVNSLRQSPQDAEDEHVELSFSVLDRAAAMADPGDSAAANAAVGTPAR